MMNANEVAADWFGYDWNRTMEAITRKSALRWLRYAHASAVQGAHSGRYGAEMQPSRKVYERLVAGLLAEVEAVTAAEWFEWSEARVPDHDGAEWVAAR